MRNNRIYISDILECIRSVRVFIGTMDFDDFVNNDLVSSAVVLKLIIIGEAAKNLPLEIKDSNPDIPWNSMSGLRDRVAHGYFGIDYEIIWEVVKKQLPALKPRIADILAEMDKQ